MPGSKLSAFGLFLLAFFTAVGCGKEPAEIPDEVTYLAWPKLGCPNGKVKFTKTKNPPTAAEEYICRP